MPNSYRAARFCGPTTPEDHGPVTPDILKMTEGDFDTPEQEIGAMNLGRDWESCMILSPTPQHDGWSYRSNGKTRPLDECIRMLGSIVSGGGNLLLNFGPDPFGEFRPEEAAIAKGMGAWLKKHGDSIYGTRGGPFTNGKWGGSTHRGKTVYLHVFEWPEDTLRLGALPQGITRARVLPGGTVLAVTQTARGVDVTVPAAQREHPVTVDLLRAGDYQQKLNDIATLADAVLIDEAHHFRNPGARGRSRYWRLFDLVILGPILSPARPPIKDGAARSEVPERLPQARRAGQRGAAPGCPGSGPG